MKSNISKHFAAKAKQGLRNCFADGMVQLPNSEFIRTGMQTFAAQENAKVAEAQKAGVQYAGPTTTDMKDKMIEINNQSANPSYQFGIESPNGRGAQHQFANQSMSDLQGGNNQPYTPGSAGDPHASASIGPKGPTRLPQASPSRTPLRQWQEPAFADGVVPETADQLMARMTAKYGAPSAGTRAPEPAPTPAPQPVQQAPQPKPQAGGLLGQAMRGLRGANDELRKAANYKDGMVHEGPGIVHGPGGPREDKVDAKLSNGEAVLPAATVEYLGGAEEVAELIQRTNGKAPAMGLRDGAHASIGGFVDKAKTMAGDVITAVKDKFNGVPPATPNMAPQMPTGPIPEPTYKPSSAPGTAPPVNYDTPTVDRKPLVVPKEYDLNAPKDFARGSSTPSSVGSAPPVQNVVPGVQSTAVAPKPIPTPAIKGLVRTTGGAALGAGMEVANKFSDMPIIGGDPTEVANRKSFYNDPKVSTGDKLINGLRDTVDIGLPVAGGTIGTVAGSGVMTLPLAAGGTYAGTKLAQGAQSLMGDSPLDRYNHKNAMAASEAERAKLMPVHNQMVEQGHMPDGSTASDKNIRPNLLPAVDKAGAKKTLDQAMAATDVNTMSERMAPETIEKVGLRQLTRDTMGKDAAIPEGAKFAFNQDGTPQMRWSGNTDEAAKTIPRGLNTTNVVKDGGGIVSFNRGNGKFDNVSLGETKYLGKDGTMGAWDKTQQFEDATKQAAKDKERLAEIQYQRAKFNATSDEITDPRARAAGLRGLAQFNTENENLTKQSTARLAAQTAAETARHNQAMEKQGVETARRAQQGQDQMQRNNRSDAFNKRYDALITEANTSEGKDGKLIVNQDGMNRMRANIGKRVDLSKMSVDDLNSSFADMAAEHNVAETLRKSAENRPTLAKARDWVNGITPEVGGNTSMKIRAAKGGKDGDWTDVGLWDAGVTGRKVIEIGGHVRELDEVLAPNGVLDRQAYDVVKRHLKQQGDEKSLKQLNKKYGE